MVLRPQYRDRVRKAVLIAIGYRLPISLAIVSPRNRVHRGTNDASTTGVQSMLAWVKQEFGKDKRTNTCMQVGRPITVSMQMLVRGTMGHCYPAIPIAPTLFNIAWLDKAGDTCVRLIFFRMQRI